MDHPNTSSASFDEVDSQPAAYARDNGLSVDSQVNPLSFHLQFNRSLPQLTPDARLNGLTSDSSLHELRIPIFPCLKEQQLVVTKEVLELLRETIQRDDNQISVFTSSQHEIRLNIANLKLEPPILKSDPDYDCHKLARIVRRRREAQIDPDTFPPEQLHVANDEALDFPESAYKFRDELVTIARNEKIDVPKEVLYCLAKSLRDDWTEDGQRKIIEEGTPRLMAVRELTVTPPLSPRVWADNYFIPSDAECQVPVASDPSTLINDDLDAAEASLLEHDILQIESLSAERLNTPTFSPLGDPPLLSPALPTLHSVKIEGPLTPVNSTPTSFNPLVDIANLSLSLDIDHVLEAQKLDESPLEDVQDNHDLSSDIIWTTLEEVSAAVMRDIEQERLESTDALARVEVPTMDFSIPEPEWQNLPLDTTSHLDWILNTHAGFEIPKWQRDLNAERQQLYWSPFLREPEIHFIESIDDNGSVEAALEALVSTEVPTSADYVWKQPGWAILRTSEEDDEGLESPPVSVKQKNLASLVKKRRLEMNISDLELSGSSRVASPVDLIQVPSGTVSTSLPSYPKAHSQFPSLLVDSSNASATSALLSNYIDFHTNKRQKHERSSFFPIATQSNPKPKDLLPSKPNKTRLEVGYPTVSTTELQQKVAVPAPCPNFNISDTPTKIIKSLTLDRGLFSRLERLYPTAAIIERDFDRWNTLSWDRNSISRSPVVSPLAAEADIAVSPTTGIIVTTLLKVIQKPPPGHKGQAAIRERVSKVAFRYERLIVLVSEDNRTDETVRDLTPFECSAYAEFCGFVVGLDMNAQVHYVGGGGDTLARWLTSSVARHAPEAAEVQELMIQDETSWELFLRRAGMNAYAAQAILASLKAPDDISEEKTSRFGLPAFVRMTPVERLQAFRGLMGGERVLNKVNEMMETVWNTNSAW